MLLAALAAPIVLFATCTSPPPLPTVDKVDLPRFMGDWFVVGHIPAGAEEEAFNGVETYELRQDGYIATTYAFREGGFDGPVEVLEPTGAVEDETTNATWGMQFFWPFWAEYLIAWLDDDYTETIIARTKRDYAWLMTRTPYVDDATWKRLTAKLAEMGYDASKVRRVPQRWPDPGHPANERVVLPAKPGPSP